MSFICNDIFAPGIAAGIICNDIFARQASFATTSSPKTSLGEDVVANDASSDAGGSDAGGFSLLGEAAQGSLFDNEPNGHDGEGLPLEGVKLYWHVIAT